MNWLFAHKRRASLIATLLVTLALAPLIFTLVKATGQAGKPNNRVVHTEQVLETIVGLREQLALADAGQRGFLLSLDSAYLLRRDAAITALREASARLSSLVAGHPRQFESAEQLAAQIDERIGLMDETMRRYRSQDAGAARDLFNSGVAQQASDRIVMIAATISATESSLLVQRNERERAIDLATRLILVVVGVIALVLSVRTYLGALTQSRRAEKRLQSIAECLPGAVYQYRLGADGRERYDFLSQSVEKIRGINRAESLADPANARDNVLAEDLPSFDAAIAHSAATLSDLSLEFRIRAADGSIRWLHSCAVPVREADDSIVWTGYWSDITDKKRDEQALRESTIRLEHAQHVARLGDWTYEVASGVLTWSKQMFVMLERDPARGAPSFEDSRTLFGVDGAAIIDQTVAEVLKTGQPQPFELRAPLPSGTLVDLSLIALAWRDDQGQLIGARGIMQDVTEHKVAAKHLVEAREMADSANRAKSIFLATMSHEIRTPMSGVLGMLELLSLTALKPDQRSALEVVRESGRSLQRVIDDILDFSKIEAGKLDIHPEPTSISHLIESVHQIYSGPASSLGLVLNYSCDPAISPALQVDGLRLRQILHNFTNNAIKFTQAGHVDVRAELIERIGNIEHIRFTVKDSGIGISAEDQRQLFQPFSQVQGAPGTSVGGTGLGLAICRRLAALMGGSIEMLSATGKGTAMSLLLPMTIADPADLVQPVMQGAGNAVDPAFIREPPTLVQARLENRAVLVVDDHPINRLVLQGQLNTLGYATATACDGMDALKQWQDGGIGLMLSDVNMPVMSGYELCRRIRALEAANGSQRLPIIACTANALAGEVENCLGASMDDYLAKPTALAQMSQKMHRWLPLDAEPEQELPIAPDVLAPARAAVDDPLDPAVLRVLTRGDAAATRRILGHFRKVNDSDAKRLLAAVSGRDFAALAHLAHRIKGASKMIGATDLALVCDVLENAGRDGNATAIDAHLPAFHHQLERLNGYFNAELC